MSLTPFELGYLMAEPALPVLHRMVRRDIRTLLPSGGETPSVLDVGGRASQYTIGVQAQVTVIDLPRETSTQADLHLGLGPRGLRALTSHRSNISEVIVGDVLEHDFDHRKFSGIVSVEVIEHIVDDRAFVRKLRDLVSADGWVYLTTPNGDYIKNEPPHYNPDHQRHYRRRELQQLLEEEFEDVIVVYAVQTGPNRVNGLRISPRHPLRATRAAWANRRNERESRGRTFSPRRSAHLVAVARP